MSPTAAGKVTSTPFDLVVSGGTVLDPATGVNQILDVGVIGDRDRGDRDGDPSG
jgi:hypothetical protein